jgi:hypothetical protein
LPNAAEIFAEAAAVALGFTDLTDNAGADVAGTDTVLLNVGAFVCSKNFVATLLTYGREPTSTEKASWFYTVPLPLFSGTPPSERGPQQRLMRCDGTSEDVDMGPFSG